MGTKIGMSHIKERRLKTSVGTGDRSTVGQHVPFYFCPRSIMLYIMFMKDHPDIDYRGGQEPIVHLVFDLNRVIEWADSNSRMWAFTDSNAGAGYTQFYFKKEELNQLRWELIPLTDFRPADVRDAKQSEFLIRDDVPWELIEEIGVFNDTTKARLEHLMIGLSHKPLVTVRKKEWYY